MSTVGVVVGNPKPRSRTLDVATAVADAAAGAASLAGATRVTVDLADFGPSLFDLSSTRVREAVDALRACSVNTCGMRQRMSQRDRPGHVRTTVP